MVNSLGARYYSSQSDRRDVEVGNHGGKVPTRI